MRSQRYLGAIPVLVDCDPVTGNMDLDDALRQFQKFGSLKLISKARKR